MPATVDPGGLPSGDRRHGARTPCFIPVRYESEGLQVDAFATNVNQRGLFVESVVKDDVGVIAKVEFDHYLLRGALSVDCRVVSSPDGGMGIAFDTEIPVVLATVVERYASHMDRPRVLMVDREPEILRVLNEWLDHAGYKFVGVQSPFKSVEGILRFRPHVLVLDTEMPGMTGADLCRLVRATPSLGRVRVLLYSDLPAPELEAMVQECEAEGGISKGARPSEVVARIEELLDETA